MRMSDFGPGAGIQFHAAICLSGHIVATDVLPGKSLGRGRCAICGQQVIYACTQPSCKAWILGDCQGYPVIVGTDAPRYCDSCGHPFPWTEQRLQALDLLVDLTKELSENQRRLLKRAARTLGDRTPETELAQAEVASIWPSIKEVGRIVIQDAFLGILHDAARTKFLTLIKVMSGK